MKSSKNKPPASKAESITVRISPKLKFGLELLSRKQHRTLSSVVEWALEKAMQDKNDGLWAQMETFGGVDCYILDYVWDIDESERLVNLAFNFPNLLTYEEEVLWKLIKENGSLWKGQFDKADNWTWTISTSSLLRGRLKTFWNIFKAVANGELSMTDLPASPTKKTAPKIPDNELLTEADIPF